MRGALGRSIVCGVGLGLLAGPAAAGTISLAWTPVAGATGYRVYYGRGPGAYTFQHDAGSATQTTLSGLDDCTDWHVAVKAYNAAGESAQFSNEIQGWARPIVDLPSPSAELQGARFTLEVRGRNFRSGATVELDNPNVVLQSARVLGCDRIQFAATIEPTTAGVRPAQIGKFNVTVVNPDGTFAARPEAFEVLVNPARFDINRSDDSTRGRIDGKDTVWLARLFGAREPDALYNPDCDLDGDGWVDGQDLAYIASNLGKCWTGSAWSTAACEGRP